MGEYIRWKGERVKLGVCEDLFYVRRDDVRLMVEGGAEHVPGNAKPGEYLDASLGWRYRFPFPDEDDRPIDNRGEERKVGLLLPREYVWARECHHTRWLRFDVPDAVGFGVNVEVPCPWHSDLKHSPLPCGFPVLLTAQKLMPFGRLVPVIECAYCQATYRIEDNAGIEALAEAALEPFGAIFAERILASLSTAALVTA